MVSDMLSQDEIDALLNHGDKESDQTEQRAEDKGGRGIIDYFTSEELDALGEIANISIGSSSTALSSLLNQKVDITTPQLDVIGKEDLQNEFPEPHVSIYVNYTAGFEGINLLFIQMPDARIIADLMLGGDGKAPNLELDDMHLSAVQEAMNQMMGSAATSMSTMFQETIDISPPSIDIFDAKDDNTTLMDQEKVMLKISFKMKVGDLIDSNIMQLIPISFAKTMGQKLLYPEYKAEQAEQRELPEQATVTTEQIGASNSNLDHASSSAQQSLGSTHNLGSSDFQDSEVRPVQFSNFDQTEPTNTDVSNLELLMDIPLQVTVELGRTKKVIRDILELSPGSIVELDKLAGEPVDILVNNKLIAKGEVVVIEENFGVRVTDILSQVDRLHKLR